MSAHPALQLVRAANGTPPMKRFLVQFLRFRRGVGEPFRTLSITAENCEAAEANVRQLVANNNWPLRAEAARIINEAGRRCREWTRAEE